MSYGVRPTGFNRKPLLTILAEIEEKAREVFGPGVIQTPESPLGQLNGMHASLVATHWEIAEATYQSYDPDQAEGTRLEQLARIRLLERMAGEADADFRSAITNAGRARIDIADINRAASAVSGLTYLQVFHNSTNATDADGIPPHSIAVAALGGDNMALASAIRPYIVPGVDSYGNTRADVTVDGYCRSIYFVRPAEIRLGLQMTVATQPDRLGCPPPSMAAIALAAATGLTGRNRPVNGRDIDLHLIRTIVSSVYPNVQVVTASVSVQPSGSLVALPYPIGFTQIAAFDPTLILAAAA